MTRPTLQSPLDRLAIRMQAAAVSLPFARPLGEVRSVSQSAVAIEGLSRWLTIGALVEIATGTGEQLAEVIRLDRNTAYCKTFGVTHTASLGDKAYPRGEFVFHPYGDWKGRIIDALAQPADGLGMLPTGPMAVRVSNAPPKAMSRQLVGNGIRTGIRVLDMFTPICLGQRIGIFAGSGVGKSTILSMLARAASFDCVIISLVGERGREVREFVEHNLQKVAAKAITVVSTGDESAMMRKLAPLTATALAEHFRDQGQHVLLIMDSITRYAHACREVALSAGEPPVARGYPPSVFSHLPHLLERSGPGRDGSGTITGVYSVLVDGDDHNDPVADAVRGTLDGHIVLDRAIAEQGRYPAVNVLASLSRLSDRTWTPEQARIVADYRRMIARFEEARDLRAMGAYVAGADQDLDHAMDMVPKLYRGLSQTLADRPSVDAFSEIAAALSA